MTSNRTKRLIVIFVSASFSIFIKVAVIVAFKWPNILFASAIISFEVLATRTCGGGGMMEEELDTARSSDLDFVMDTDNDMDEEKLGALLLTGRGELVSGCGDDRDDTG